MATIANLQILLSARADGLQKTVGQSVESLRRYVKTVDAMKEAKVNFSASLTEVRAAVIQGKRLIQNLGRTPVAIQARAKFDQAIGQINKLRSTPLAITMAAKAERVTDFFAITGIRIRNTADSMRVRMSAASNLVGMRIGRMFDPLKTRGASALAAVQAKIGKLGLKGVMPFGMGDVAKSLGPFAGLAKSAIRVPIAVTTSTMMAGLAKGKSLLGGFVEQGMGLFKSLAGGAAMVGIAGAAIGVGLLASVAAFTASSMDSIDAMNDQSQVLGMNVKALGQLSYAAKLSASDQETLVGGLTKLSNNLGTAAMSGGPLVNTLRSIGLDAKGLAQMAPDEAFLAIADAMTKIDNPTQRTALAMDLFGKSGARLVPMLSQGKVSIQELMAEADKLGASFNLVDASKVAAANDSIDRMKFAVQGVGNSLAIGLSPYIDAASAKFVEMATSGEGIGPKVAGGLEWVASSIATAADYTNLLPAAFYGFRSAALTVLAEVMRQIDVLGEGLVATLNLAPGVSLEWTSAFGDMRDGLEQIAVEDAQKVNDAMAAFHRGDNAASVKRVFDDIKKRSDEAATAAAGAGGKMKNAFAGIGEDAIANIQSITDSITNAADRVERLKSGMSEEEFKLKKAGATQDQINQMKGLQGQAKSMEEAQRISETFRSNAEKLRDRMNEISDAAKADPGLSQERINRAIEQAKKDFNNGVDAESGGSKGAFSGAIAAVERRSADGLVNALGPTQDLAKKQLDETKKQTTTLTVIATNIGKNAPTTASIDNL